MDVSMNNILFNGIYSATFSLYDEHLNVLKDSVKKLIQYNLSHGIKGFYVGGNTGECTVLPNRTRLQMLETVKEYTENKGSIIAHVGAGHLDDVKALIDSANNVGVDAIASLPPSLTAYYKADEVVEYYRYIASLTSLPVLAYVTPVLNCDVVSFAKRIMEIDNVVGLKVSIADYFVFQRLKTVNGGNINILNGPDESMLAGLVMGADGAIGTSYNFMPSVACRIYDSFNEGRIAEARENQGLLNRAITPLLGRSIAHWKIPLSFLDIDPGYTVFPAYQPDENDRLTLKRQFEEGGALAEMQATSVKA
jgi:N-acetylneuraminate lyase